MTILQDANVTCHARHERRPPLYSVRHAARLLKLPEDRIRTWIIDHDLHFDIVGRVWVLGETTMAGLRRIKAEHARKAKARGLKPVGFARGDKRKRKAAVATAPAS